MQLERYFDKADCASSWSSAAMLGGGRPVKHILAPTDLTDHSRQSVACALCLARGFGANLTLLHVWPGQPSAEPPFSPLYAGQLQLGFRNALEKSRLAEQTLRAVRDRIRKHHSATDDCFLLGDPNPLILTLAKDLDADLLVISAHHYDWLGRLLDGYKSDTIIRDAPCPVFVVPGTEREPIPVRTDNSWLKTKRAKAALAWAKNSHSSIANGYEHASNSLGKERSVFPALAP